MLRMNAISEPTVNNFTLNLFYYQTMRIHNANLLILGLCRIYAFHVALSIICFYKRFPIPEKGRKILPGCG